MSGFSKGVLLYAKPEKIIGVFWAFNTIFLEFCIIMSFIPIFFLLICHFCTLLQRAI